MWTRIFSGMFSKVTYTANMYSTAVVILCVATAVFGARLYIPKYDTKIVGGELANIRLYPYQVSLRFENSHSCGGSVIDEITILTACHCVHSITPERLSVRAGTATQDWNGQLVLVSQVIEHPDYKPNTFENDIALVKLETPLMFNNLVEPVRLPAQGEFVRDGAKAIITGWGLTSQQSNFVVEELRMARLHVISNEECINDYGGQALVSSSMICATAPGIDSCQGDSGGPLVSNGKQIGIVSWGFGCADPKFPGVYTRVSDFRNWIDMHTRI